MKILPIIYIKIAFNLSHHMIIFSFPFGCICIVVDFSISHLKVKREYEFLFFIASVLKTAFYCLRTKTVSLLSLSSWNLDLVTFYEQYFCITFSSSTRFSAIRQSLLVLPKCRGGFAFN